MYLWLPCTNASCSSNSKGYSRPPPFEIPARSSFCWTSFLEAQCYHCLAKHTMISIQKVGASPSTCSVLVMHHSEGFAEGSIAQWPKPVQSKHRAPQGRVKPHRALESPENLYSFTLNSEAPLCFSLQKWKEGEELSNLISGLPVQKIDRVSQQSSEA